MASSSSSPTPTGGSSSGGVPLVLTPLQIAKKFVRQYYEVLMTEPDKIGNFYREVSIFSHGKGNEPVDPIVVAESDLLKDQLFRHSSLAVDLGKGSIDAQTSLGGLVLVVVTGLMIIDGQRKTFCHTFLLKSWAEKKFYVHNDVLRFLLEEQEEDKETTSVASSSKDNQPAVVEQGVADAVVAREEVVVVSAQKEPVVTAATQEALEAMPVGQPTPGPPATILPAIVPEVVSPEPVTSAAAAAAAAAEEIPLYEPALEPEPPAEETKEDVLVAVVEQEREGKSKRKGRKSGRKKSPSPSTTEDTKEQQAATGSSWASLVAINASKPAPPSPTRRTEKKEREPQSPKEEKQDHKSPDQQQQGSKQQQQQRPPKRDPDCTLVIKNVPDSTRDREVRELFEPFAKQTNSRIVGLNVSGRANLAFVDYDSPAPVLLALQDKQQFQLHGRILELEPKMVDRSRSRGSFRKSADGSSNGFRGSGRSGSQHRRRGSGGGRGDRSGSGSGGRGGRGGR